MKFFKKRITESEFEKALANCANIAKRAYKRTLEYQKEIGSILEELNINLGKKTFTMLNDKDVEHFEFYEVIKKIVAELQKYSKKGFKDLKDAVETKSNHLKDFTITLFGRTKTGKSTIRESITKNGDGSTIGLGDLHTTKEAGDYKWKGLRLLDTPGVEGYGGEKEVEKAHEVIDQTDIVIFLTTDETQQPGEFDEMERLVEINKPFFVLLNIKDKLTDPVYLKRFFRHKASLFDREIVEEHKQRILSETKRIGTHNANIVWISALASCISQFAERGFTFQNKEDFPATIQHSQIRPIIRWFLDNLKIQEARYLWQLSQIEKVYERIAFEVNTRGQQRRVLTFFDSTINFIDTIVKMLWEHQCSLRAQANFMLEKQWELECFFDGTDFKGMLKKLMSGNLTEGKVNFLKWKLKRYIRRVHMSITPEDMAFVEAKIKDWSNLLEMTENGDKKVFDLTDVFEKYLPRRKGFVEESEGRIEAKCRELFQSYKEWIADFVDEYLGKDNAQTILKRRLNKERKTIEEKMKGLIDEIVKDLQAKLHEFSQQYKYDIGTIKAEPSGTGGFRKGQTGKILRWTGVAVGGTSAVAFGIGAFAAANFWNPVGWIAAGTSVVVGFLSWLFGKNEEEKWLKVKRKAKEQLWNIIDKMERKTRGTYKTWFYKNITTKGRRAMFEQVSTYIEGLKKITDDLKKYASRLMELQEQVNKELFTWLLRLEGIKCSEKDILSIAREQGVATKVMVPDSQHIDGRIRANLEKLCGEHILFFSDSDNIRDRIIRALYPAKPSSGQIQVIQDNEQRIARIAVPDKEKGLYIGKNGVNIRLTQRVCRIKIELI